MCEICRFDRLLFEIMLWEFFERLILFLPIEL